MPIEITGTPAVFPVISRREFPIPEPGRIPESEICTVAASLSRLRAHSASITMSASGFPSAIPPLIIVRASIPVCPSVPGTIADMREQPSESRMPPQPTAWRVTVSLSRVCGPRASEVINLLPSPQTSTEELSEIF